MYFCIPCFISSSELQVDQTERYLGVTCDIFGVKEILIFLQSLFIFLFGSFFFYISDIHFKELLYAD